jgi:hypothetical protein
MPYSRTVYFGDVHTYVQIEDNLYACTTLYKTRQSSVNNMVYLHEHSAQRTRILPVKWIKQTVSKMESKYDSYTYFFWQGMISTPHLAGLTLDDIR